MSSNKKFYISIVIFAILGILLIVFLIHPLFKEIKKNSEAFLSEREKIISLAKEAENRKKTENLYKSYQPDLERMEKIFVDPEVPIELISFLEENASSSQIQLKISSMAKKSEKGDPWPSLLIQLSATGSLPDFLEFLEKLEAGPYLIEVLDLNARKLTEKELGSKEFENSSLADTDTFLAIKVFTK